MTPEQKVAYVIAQSVAAAIELQAMLAANHERAENGHSLCYGEEQINSLIERYGLDHNSVIGLFQE